MPFSRRHYRFVSPREATPTEIAAGRRLDAVLRQATEEMKERFPAATVENCGEMLEWHRERITELRREAGV